MIAIIVTVSTQSGGSQPPNPTTGPTAGPAPTTVDRPAPGTIYAPAGSGAYVYSAPSLVATVVATLANGAAVQIACTQQGQVVTTADGRSSSLWDKVPDGYIPDVNVYTGQDEPTKGSCQP